MGIRRCSWALFALAVLISPVPERASLDEPLAMAAAAKKAGVHLLVNYETTWYAANQAAYKLIREQKNQEPDRRPVFDVDPTPGGLFHLFDRRIPRTPF